MAAHLECDVIYCHSFCGLRASSFTATFFLWTKSEFLICISDEMTLEIKLYDRVLHL